MTARVYGFSFSHPVQCARAMLRHKGIEHSLVTVPPGAHPAVMRALGFPGGTVPGVVIDGRRLQGTLEISRALDELAPEPPLFPAERRAEVEAAEAWAESTLQHVPRRAFRWALASRQDVREEANRRLGLPLAGYVALAMGPPAMAFARVTGVSPEVVERDVRALPEWLERADDLVAQGTIGGDAPNAADFQIGSTVAALLAFEDFEGLLAGRPVFRVAERHFRPPKVTLPRFLPAAWLSG